MSGVVLPYSYILQEWRVEKHLYRDEHYSLQTYYVTLVVLVITNPAPIDLSFHVTLFDQNGNEQFRPAVPRASGYSFAPDVGFPMSGKIAPRNQIRLLLDSTLVEATLAQPDVVVRGWGRIATSYPVPIHAFLQGTSGMGEILPITLQEPVTAPATTGNPVPPPPRSAPPPPEPLVLAELPKRINPDNLTKGEAGRFLSNIQPPPQPAPLVKAGWLEKLGSALLGRRPPHE